MSSMLGWVADIELLALSLGLVLFLAYYLGRYMVHLIRGTPRPFEGVLSKVENSVFRLAGIDPKKSMDWKEYVVALLLVDAAFAVFTYLVLGLQGTLPGDPRGLAPFSWDLNFNTASSFITNTNLQHYAGDQTLDVTSQLVLMLNQFVAPASAIAVGLAFLRPFIQKGNGVGNFYVDFVRSTFTILLPIAFVSAILLMAIGVPQTLNGTLTTGSIAGGPQTFVVGPLAGFDSIMELGQNGGGYYAANLASPFANPNGVSNVVYLILMLVIPLAFIFAYGELVGRGRGRALMVAVLAPFLALLAYSVSTASGPLGLETRFGGFGSVLFQFFSISSDTGSTNAVLSGLSPRTGASLFTFMFVQAIPGGSGVGFMTLVIYAFLTLFMVGLMVGKTPEFLGMKISGWDVKLAVLTFIVHPLMILVPAAIAYSSGNVAAILGPHSGSFGFTQVFYEYTSASANNGSDYLGTLANTPFWNVSTAIVMLVGRFAPIVFMMGIAGSFATKDRRDTPEPIRTDGWAFTVTLIGVTFVLTALAFLPFLILGIFG
jgi:potassium-transporting ATPase potassium-binding subunit